MGIFFFFETQTQKQVCCVWHILSSTINKTLQSIKENNICVIFMTLLVIPKYGNKTFFFRRHHHRNSVASGIQKLMSFTIMVSWSHKMSNILCSSLTKVLFCCLVTPTSMVTNTVHRRLLQSQLHWQLN